MIIGHGIDLIEREFNYTDMIKKWDNSIEKTIKRFKENSSIRLEEV